MAKQEEIKEILSELLNEIENQAFVRYQQMNARDVKKKWAEETATVYSHEYAEVLHKAMRRAVSWHEAIAHLPQKK